MMNKTTKHFLFHLWKIRAEGRCTLSADIGKNTCYFILFIQNFGKSLEPRKDQESIFTTNLSLILVFIEIILNHVKLH